MNSRRQHWCGWGSKRNLRDSLPHASFIGFTGTPIEKTDANTRAVFGDYISIYDIQRAVADNATELECRIRNVELPELRNSHFCIRTSYGAGWRSWG